MEQILVVLTNQRIYTSTGKIKKFTYYLVELKRNE